VAYYYYRFESERAPYNEISSVLRALIKQITRQLGHYDELHALHQANRDTDATSLAKSVWRDMLLTLCQRADSVYLVFDGLDVPSDRDRESLIRFLDDFRPYGVRILLTSRPIFTSLTKDLEGCLVLDLRAPPEGLASFVESLLQKKPALPPGLLKKGYNVKSLARIIAKATSSSMYVRG
jgi:hypothetical protein